MPWLRVKQYYFEIILKLFLCFISHATTSETETIILAAHGVLKYFKIISATLHMLQNIRELQ